MVNKTYVNTYQEDGGFTESKTHLPDIHIPTLPVTREEAISDQQTTTRVPAAKHHSPQPSLRHSLVLCAPVHLEEVARQPVHLQLA